jgi:hypothetical protein
MNREEFEDALAAHGADLARWPAGLAERGRALAARDPEAARRLAQAARLDALLAEAMRPAPVDAALVGRIIAGVQGGHGSATPVRPTGRLFAWAGASMAVFLVAGFMLGTATPWFSDDEDALAELMFGGSFIVADGEVL